MSDSTPSLEETRREIDAIDDALHDLLIRRTEAVQWIAAAKRGSAPFVPFRAAFRPSREAQILRRLSGRHRGDLPREVLVFLWRAIMSAKLALQSPFSVYVFAPEGRAGLWDTARAHFGAGIPFIACSTPLHALQGCAQDASSIAVVPYPQSEDSLPAWWSHMAQLDHEGPRVVARLPFMGGSPDNQALAFAAAPTEPTGEDTTLILIEVSGDTSRTRLASLFKQASLPAQIIAAAQDAQGKGPIQFCLEIEGFLREGDPRLLGFAERARDCLNLLFVAGGYANPIAFEAARQGQATP
ncbi:MAG: chorismate mutase [Alphaproteobacteria bacterium]|nr:chorismate mutase [Alphaproteobacteria bacterium]